MALTILSGPTGLFDADTRDKASAQRTQLLADFSQAKFPRGTALVAGTAAADLALKNKQVQTARNWVTRYPDFTVEALTDAAETATLIELISRGVTFPAGTERDITLEVYAAGNSGTERGWTQSTFIVGGATTPTLPTVTNPGPTAFAGFTTSSVGLAAGSGVLNCQVTSGEAEPINWKMNVYVGKLRAVRVPAT